MQISTTKTVKRTLLCAYLLLTGIIGISHADTHFNDLFLIEPAINKQLADRIAMYHSEDISLPVAQQITELVNINKKLQANESKFSNKSLFWFLQGLNHSNLASAYNSNKQPQLTKQHLDLKNLAYKKAISLDKNRNRLSAAIYSTMKFGLPEDLKITATQNELALGGNGYSDSYYWYLHWSNIDQLKKAGRDAEAEAAYQNMKKELSESDMDTSIYSSLTSTIEQKTLQHSKPEVKPEPAKKPVEKNPEPSDSATDSKTYIIIAFVIAAILALAVVTIYELVFRKKRKR